MLSHDTGYLINTPDILHMILDMLSLGNLMLWHSTGYYNMWYLY